VVTGRVFTVPVVDLELPGPLLLEIERIYSSTARDRDVGLGFGFTHSLAWEIIERRAQTIVHTHDGLDLDFGTIAPGEGRIGAHGWILHREGSGFALDLVDGRRLVFVEVSSLSTGKRHRLTQVVDRHGNEIVLKYRQGVLFEIVDSVGRVVRVSTTREGRIASLALKGPLADGEWITLARYTYDDAGRLVSVEDADGGRTSFSYDDGNRLLSQTRPGGLTFFYRYDRRGRCVETWGEHPGGDDPSLSPDVPTRLADGETRAKGVHHAKLVFGDRGYSEVSTSVTTLRYFGNEHGKLDKADAGGAVFTRRFDERGFLLELTDACQATTTWERDLRGRETKIVDGLGRTTVIEREPDGHIRKIVEPNGGVTVVERTPTTIWWRDPIGATFSTRYDARGLIAETVAPNGDVTRYRYDDHANLVERTDAEGGVSRSTYDAWGRCTSTTDAGGATTRYTHSLGGKVLAVVSPDGATTRYEYDPAGRVTAITDALGRTTQAYGGLDRLCEVVAPDGGRVSLRYDREGRLSTVTNARGEVHRFVRRSDGLVIEERTFDGRTLRFQYDAMGRRIKAVNGAGEAVTIERDLLGRMVTRQSGDREEHFEYDVRGDVIRARADQVEVGFERNLLGWIVRETQRVGDQAIVVDVDYDLMGRVARRSTSRGHSLAWERRGSLASVVLDGAERVNIAFDAMGREISRQLPQGGWIQTAYDAAGRLSSRRVHEAAPGPRVGEGEPAWVGAAPGGVTVDQRYAFSSALLAARWDQALGLTRFEYDPLGRLLSVIPEHARAELFRYGPGGELHEAHAPRAYGAGGRLLQAGGVEYTWDRAGRVSVAMAANGETTRYEWSPAGQLLAVEKPDGSRVEIEYDAFDRRLLKRTLRAEGGARRTVSTTRFVWDATTLVHEIKTTAIAGGDPVVEERTFCFEEHRSAPWAQRDVRIAGDARTESGWFHYLNDDSGAPERLVDGTGRVAGELRWTAWGRAQAAPGGVTTTPFRFRGQYADEETGLSYNFHRYYDPATGRYLSADPIGLHGGPDPFAYANNCPTSAVDVEGLMYSIIRDRDGNVVAEGQSAGATPPGTSTTQDAWNQYPQGCAEKDALRKLGTPADASRKFAQEGYTIETYEGNKRDYENASNRERLRMRANPCDKCAAMFHDLGIAGQVRAPNENQGTTRGRLTDRWNGTATYGNPNG
jgi:RHS repeat-associated protein